LRTLTKTAVSWSFIQIKPGELTAWDSTELFMLDYVTLRKQSKTSPSGYHLKR